MRGIFFALAIGLALIAGYNLEYVRTEVGDVETSYTAGSNYVYSYETQVVSGLPLTAPVYSIMKVKALVHLNFQTANRVVMKMEDVKLFKMNGRVESFDPVREQVPEEILHPLTAEDAAVVAQTLTIPIKFRYTDGFVSGIVAEAEDPVWSLNFKKGCLSMLQVNLDKSKVIETSEAIYAETYAGEMVNEAYTVMETSPAGECACTYSVQEVSATRDQEYGDSYFEVTKVRDFDNCLERPIFFTDTFGGKACSNCEVFNNDPLDIVSECRYELTGNREDFFIQTAVGESRYILTTESQGNGYAATIVNQTLEFVSSEAIRAPIRGPRVPAECPEGIIAIEPKVLRHKKIRLTESALAMAPPELREIEDEPEREGDMSELFVREALSALRAVAIDFEEGVTEEGPSISMVATDVMRAGTTEELKIIWEKCTGEEEEGSDEEIEDIVRRRRRKIWRRAEEESSEEEIAPRRRSRLREEIEDEEEGERVPIKRTMKKTLWYLLPYVGTVPAVKTLCEAIERDEISEVVLAHAIFPNLALFAEPVPENLELILELVKSEKIPEGHVKRSGWLCVGALVYRMDKTYTETEEELIENLEKTQILLTTEGRGKPRVQLQYLADKTSMMREAIVASKEEVKKLFIEEVTELLQSSDEEEKIIGLKACGNAGLPELIPLVVEIVRTSSYPTRVRQQAVYCMRRMTDDVPKVILDVLLPVYMDVTEHEIVRIAAFTTMMKCEPPLPYFQIIARTLDDEENPQVGSYVYSYLSEMSNSTYPCFLELASNCSAAMKFAKKVPENIHSSYMWQMSSKNEERSIAHVLEMSVLGSRDSILPKGISVTALVQALGYSIELGEVGIDTRGVQAILDRLVGPSGSLTEGRSILDILRPKRSMNSASEVINNLARTLKIVERELEQTSLEMFVKYQGNELSFLSLNTEVIKDLVESGNIFTDISEDSLKEGMALEFFRPQPLGGIKAIIPTECGLPLTIHAHAAALVSLTGRWNAEVMPSLFESFRRGSRPTSLKAEIDIEPSIAMDVYVCMAVDTAIYKTAVRINNRAFVHNINLKGTIEADFKKGKWFTTLETPTEEKKIAGLKSKPVTFFTQTNALTISETMEISNPENGVVFPITEEIFPEFNFGSVVGIRALFTTDGDKPGSVCFPMSGKQSLVVYAAPDENSAEKVEINLQVVASDEFARTTEREEEAEGSVVSKILDTFLWGEDTPETEGDWDEEFDLSEKDVSIAAVAEETGAPLLEDARRNALALTIEGVGTTPVKKLHVQSICQRSVTGRRTQVNTKICNTFYGHKEVMEMNVAINFNRKETTIEELTSPEYKNTILEYIKTMSTSDPITEETVSRANAWWSNDWQRLVTGIRGSEVPRDTEREDIETPELGPVERAVCETVEEIINRQERIARRVADPVLQTMAVAAREKIAERVESILEETKEVEREAERILLRIRQRILGRITDKRVFLISLKIHHALVHHRNLLERIEELVKSSPITRSRRIPIVSEIREQTEGCRRLVEIHERIVKEVKVPEEELLSLNMETEPELGATLGRLAVAASKQIEIAVAVHKVREAVSNGAEISSIIPQTKQILEHCHEIVDTTMSVARELNNVDEEDEAVAKEEDEEEESEEEDGPAITSIIPHMKVFKVIMRQDLLFQEVKDIREIIKYAPDCPVEEIIEIGEGCRQHINKLQALLGEELEAYNKIIMATAEKTAENGAVPELPSYMTAYINVTRVSEIRRPIAVEYKIWAEKSLEQLVYEYRQSNEKTRDPLIAKILDEATEVPECEIERVREELNTLRKFKINVNFPPELAREYDVKRTRDSILSYLVAKNLWKVSYGVANVTSEPGEARLNIQFSRTGDEVSYMLMNAEGTTKFWGVGVPKICPAGVSMRRRETGLVERIRGRFRTAPAVCTTRLNSLETFDGETFEVPEAEECEKVLAMDCSPEKTFVVTVASRRSERVIKVVVEKQVVEIIPRESESRLRINGAVTRLIEEPIIIRGEGVYKTEPIVLRVERRPSEIVIRAERTGIAIRVSPEYVKIEASPFFRSKCCGLCGNYDGRRRGEFEDPELRIHARPESFGVSYVVPGETCNKEELETRFPPEIVSRPEVSECTPIRRHVVKERQGEEEREICISTRHLRRCPERCEPRGAISKTVGFHCLPARDPSVQRLAEEAETRVVRKLLRRENDIYEEVIEPEECIIA